MALLFAFFLNTDAKAQFTTAGDIAFTGYLGGTTSESFSFVVLKNIPSGSVLNFTDYGWTGVSFQSTVAESICTWTTGDALIAGREVTISGAANSPMMTVTISGVGNPGTMSGNMVSLPTSGDQIFAYVGTFASPTFIAGIHMNSYNNGNGGSECGSTTTAGWDPPACANPGNANSSALPSGLTGGVTAVYIGVDNTFNSDFDNAVFNCAGSLSTPLQVRAAVNTYAPSTDWTTENGIPTITLPSGCSYLVSTPMVNVSGTPLFGFTSCSGVASSEQSFIVSGTDLTGNVAITAPSGFEISTTSGSGFSSLVTLTPSGGFLANTTIFVRMASNATGTPTGNITVASSGAPTVNIAVSGTVNPTPPTPTITPNGPTTFCQGGSVLLTSSASTGNTWSTGQTTQSITVSVGGTYTVMVTVAGCTSAASPGTTVTVDPLPPSPTITPNGPTTFCIGDSVILSSSPSANILWSTGATTPSITVKVSGTYTVTQTVSGCTSPPSAGTTVTVNALPTVANAGSDRSLCLPSSALNLTGNTPAVGTGTWSQINGPVTASITNANNPLTSVTGMNTVGIYTFVWTIANAPCPASTDTMRVTVATQPASFNIVGSATCQGNVVTLTGPSVPGITYTWQRSLSGITNTYTTFGGAAQTQQVTSSGNYQLIISNSAGCSASDTAIMHIADYRFSGSLGAGDPSQTGRINRLAQTSVCPGPKAFPGMFATTGARLYDAYTITNVRPVSVCATVGIASSCGTNMFNVAYSGSFNPADPSQNYLGDPGSSFPAAGFMEITIPANGTIVLVVHEVNPGTGCTGYLLTVDLPRDLSAIVATPPSVVLNSTSTLTAPAANSYLWSPGGATTQSITSAPITAPMEYKVTLGYGNIGCSRLDSVTVNLSCTPASITCPGNISQSNTPGTCGRVVNYMTSSGGNPAPTVTYTFSGATSGSGSGDGSGSTFNVGVTTVVVTASNGCSSDATCTFTVTISDTQPPVVTSGTIGSCYPTVAAAQAAALAATSATDNCPGTLTETASTVGTCSAVVTVVTTDAAGNSAQVTYNTRIDNTPPLLTCPANTTVCGTAAVPVANIALVTGVSDNCPGTITVTHQGDAINSPSSTAPYTITRTYRVTDGCGNFTDCTQTILVNPIPNAVATPSSQTICSSATITTIALTGNVSGTTYNWTRDNTTAVTGIAASGSGNISGALTNTTNAPVVVTFTITPIANNCTGPSILDSVIVLPTPNAVATPSSQTICSAATITTIALTGNVSGTTYNWTRNNTATVTGIAASGSGNISGALTNTTNAPVTVTFTITPTANNCPGTPITATVLVNPTPNAVATPSSQTICSAATISTIALTGNVSGTTYNWTRDNTASVTGIAASGSGNISGVLTNTTNAPVTVTFTITPTANNCPGTPITATVLVNPTPNAIATPSSQTICSAATITTIALTGNVSGTTYNWTRDNTAAVTGIAASGSGNISGALTNTTNAPVVVTFTITPIANNCTGPSILDSVIVLPTPNAVATPSSQTICSAGTITTIALTGNVSGTTYNWTRDNTASVTGIAASGSGNISGALTNTTNAPVTVTFTITPTANNCPGTPITATVLVNPTPNAVATPSSQTICSAGTITTIALTGNVSGTTYNWTRDNTAAVTGIAASGSGNISGALTNTTNAPVTVTFTITPTANNCPGTPITATVVVNPTPNAVATPSSQTICSAATITTIALTGNVSGTTYNWTRNNTATVTGIAASGSGNISGALTNTTNAPVTVTFTITPTANNCPGAPITATVLVNPTPNAVVTPLTQTICSEATITTLVLSGAVSGTTYSWTRDNTATVTGIAASGTTNISGALTNTTNLPVTVSFTVTPSANGCTGPTTVATVIVNPKPIIYTVTGGGQYCAGGLGMDVGLTGSQIGVNYQLQLNNVNIGSPLAGTGSAITFIDQTGVGNYTVVATNAFGCISTMTGSVAISTFNCTASIADPCVCKNNATNLENGQFGETITVNAPAGQTWVVSVVKGLFNVASPAPPAAPNAITVGTVLTASGTTYTLNGIHIDEIGYMLSVTNNRGTTLSISNSCKYPNPVITSDLSELFCINGDPVLLTGIAGDNNVVSEVFAVNGVPSTSFDPSLGVGIYQITYTVNGGLPKAASADDPGCIQTVGTSAVVIATPSDMACHDLVNVSLGVDCQAEINPSMILAGLYGCLDDYEVTIAGLPSNVVNGSNAGKTYVVTVTHLVSGNSCWGSIRVEDKLPPQPECGDFTVRCIDPISATPIPPFNASKLPMVSTPIPFEGGTVSNAVVSTLEIPEYVNCKVTDLDVLVNVTDDWMGDLNITVTSPAGTTSTIWGGFCGFTPPGLNFVADDEGTNSNQCVDYQSGANLTLPGLVPTPAFTVFDGEDVKGTWSVRVWDQFDDAGVDGVVNELELRFASCTAPGFFPKGTCGEDFIWTFTDNVSDKGCDGELITRTWIAKDEVGNTGSCIQKITVTNITLADISLPPSLIEMNSCGTGVTPADVAAFFDIDSRTGTGIGGFNDDYTEAQGSPAGVVELNEGYAYGYPHYFAVGRDGNLHAQKIDNNVCSIYATYTDQVLAACGAGCVGNSKVIRTWTLLDWCTLEQASYIQVIKAVDQKAPTFIVKDITVSVNPWGCVANFDAPMPWELADNCDANPKWWIEGPAGVIITGNSTIGYKVTGAPKGVHNFTYKAIDCCGNIGTAVAVITVIDRSAPVAVAKQNIVISLTGSGTGADGAAKLYTNSVDNGSYDHCTDIKLELRRPDGAPSCGNLGIDDHNNNVTYNNDENFSPGASWKHPEDDKDDTDEGAFVKFCCEDLAGGESAVHQVWMRVWDDGNMNGIIGDNLIIDGMQDNYNETWADVRVENKLAPVIVCPNDATVTCDMELNISTTWRDVSEVVLATGEAEAFDLCNGVKVEYKDTPTWTNTCENVGRIRREFRAVKGTKTVNCFQTITVGALPSTFVVTPPSNSVLDAPCDFNKSDIKASDKPKVQSGPCDVIGEEITIDTFYFEDGVCKKWRVTYNYINWCTGEQKGPYVKYYKYKDEVKPVLTCQDQMFAANPNPQNPLGGCEGTVNLEASATDEGGCIAGGWLKWTVIVDLWGNGTDDYEFTSFLPTTDNNLGNDTNGNGIPDRYVAPTSDGQTVKVPAFVLDAEMSTHKVFWKVTDGCGNVTSCNSTFMVVDKKAPTPYCVSLSSALMENGQVELWAIDFNKGSFDNCTPQNGLLYTFNGENPVLSKLGVEHYFKGAGLDATAAEYNAGNAQRWVPSYRSSAKIFNTVGEVEVHMSVWDGKLNTDFCKVILTLIDNNAGSISGNLTTVASEPIDKVNVRVNANVSEFPQFGTFDGRYYFTTKETADYTVIPTKTDDYTNGVSTLDLVLIQRHILGINKLNTPEKLIAADVNRDGKVSASDLVELRKLILGMNAKLANNDSWAFVPKSYVYPVATNPYNAPRSITVNVSSNVKDVNFTGIKIGDVNLDAVAVAGVSSDNRTSNSLRFEAEDKEVKAGEVVTLDVTAANFAEIFGYQFTAKLTGAELLDVRSGAINVEESYGMPSANTLTMSYASDKAVSLNANEVLFTIILRAKESGRISKLIAVGSDVTRSESYAGAEMTTNKLELNFRTNGEVSEGFVLNQNEPNPFKTNTVVSFNMPAAAKTTITLTDVTGKVVNVKHIDAVKGMNKVEYNRNDVPVGGVVYYTLTSGEYTATKAMMVIE